MGTLRRDLLKYAGGLSAGIVFTPVPWKVLDDVSIWSQNWSWIPRPLRGEITQKFTQCTLCPAACGVRANCVAGQPYQVAGIAEHPVGRPTLCPAGLAAHQLPYAPARVQGDAEKALEAAAARVRDARTVVIVEDRPGRCASEIYRRIAAESPTWKHVLAPGSMGALGAYSKITGVAAGVDYDRVRTVLSFGAPVLHGWSTPGRMLRRRSEYKLIQVEASQSRTAAFADVWVPVKPGSEDAFALAVAKVLIEEKLVDNVPAAYREAVAMAAPMERAEEVARAFAKGPSVALGSSEAIAALNVLLGERAAISQRGDHVPTAHLGDVADRSADVVIVDAQGALPPLMVHRKLRKGGALVVVAAYASDLTQAADIVIPAPAWLESQEDAPGPMDAPTASFGIASALVAARPGTIAAGDAVARLAGVGDTVEKEIGARVAAIHKSGRGKVFKYADGTSAAVSEMKVEELTAALTEGCWVDEPARRVAVQARINGLAVRAPHESTMLHVDMTAAPVPMLAKLYQESDLFARSDVARVHPETAERLGLAGSKHVEVQTVCGTGRPALRIDETVAPGLVQISALSCGKRTALRLCEDLPLSKAAVRRAS